MKKIAIITMMILLIAGLFVACNQDEIVDDQLNSKITITFDANGGTGSMAPLTVKKGDAVKLPVVKFTKEGNIFVWWEDKSGNAYGDEVTIYPDADLVLYAQWMEVIDITSSTTSMTPGKAYRTKDATTTITERITVEDGEEAVVVILTEGTTLKAQKGIEVKAGEKLVIQGSGKLNATSTGDEAGIGGGTGDDKDSGDIIIEGGEITVTGGTGGGAGIGGGKGGKGGVINLEGGKINTTGGTGGGSGIGGGEGGDFETINITGGEITSNGGKDAAGIGGGAGGKGGTINISGGKTKAQGNGGGSGIGGGKGEKVETIRIGKTDVDTPEIEAIGGETGDTVGIGKGAGSAGEDEIILIDMRLKCGPTETPEYWELYDEETPNPQKVMATLNNDVTVTFNANNGTGSMPVQVVPAGKATTLKGNDFTRKGYAFKGWAKSATATAKDYDDGAPVTLTQDTVLYAYWEVSTIEPFPTTEPVVLAGGVYKTEENKTIKLTERVRLKNTDPVTIIVAKGTTLDTKGITVTESQTLVIETEEGAKLIADAYKVGESSYSESYAGIGGEYDNSPSFDKTCGTIVIKGKGTVIATGGVSGGAGIGGSRENDGGVITINSGNVIATGNGGGAGIGGGCGGNGGTITFNGGTVEANGKAGGAGIGGGRKNTAAGGNGGTINIYEGAIVATGEEGGAGIGGGGNCGNSGKITVKRSSPTSLTIFATGGDSGSGSGDGLGRGYGGSEYRNIDSGDFLRYRDNTTEFWKIVGPSSSGKYVRTDGAVTVKFDGNGATQGSMTDITNVTLGDTVELPKNTFTNGDKIFMGWNDRADGNGNGCADEMSFQVTKETTLYAQWATYTTMTSSDKVLEGGKAYKVSGDITIADRVTIDGNTPVLIYLDKTSLTAEQGITVKEGQTLIIDGADDEYSYLSAELVPTEHNGAGIGSGDGTTCGTIIINGGRIEARGNIDCAGIGGGKYSGCDNGTVVINGGDVTATGRDYAAGIGGGKSGNGGVITINGGTVKAYGQSYESSSNLGGAGIGGGLSGSGGVITITGGTVTATGSMYGAGIGSGHATNPGECNGGIITITGGSVKAYGGKNGAGIGGGHCANSGTTSIKKTGEYSPVVYAMAGDKDSGVVIAPEGIGHGGSISTSSTAINLDGVTLAVSSDDKNWTPYDGSNRQRYMRTSVVLTSSITEWSNGNLYTLGSDDVTISGRVTVTGKVILLLPAGRTLTVPKGITVAGTNKLTIGGSGTLSIPKDDENGVAVSNAGIGGDSGAPTAGTIIINGGTITVYGGGCGAGIGGGNEGNGGTITISGGTVNAFGGQGAGIGGGYNGSAGKINISGGTVNATGDYHSAGIGSGNGYTGNEGEINISNASTLTPTIVTAHGGDCGAGIGGGMKSAGGTINITGGTVTAYGGQYGGAGIGGGDGGAGGVITISGASTKVYAKGSNEYGASGIGKGSEYKSEGTLNISDVVMRVSTDNNTWNNYTTVRAQYMKTSNY